MDLKTTKDVAASVKEAFSAREKHTGNREPNQDLIERQAATILGLVSMLENREILMGLLAGIIKELELKRDQLVEELKGIKNGS